MQCPSRLARRTRPRHTLAAPVARRKPGAPSRPARDVARFAKPIPVAAIQRDAESGSDERRDDVDPIAIGAAGDHHVGLPSHARRLARALRDSARPGRSANGSMDTAGTPAASRSPTFACRGEKTRSYSWMASRNHGARCAGFHGSSVRKFTRTLPSSPIVASVGRVDRRDARREHDIGRKASARPAAPGRRTARAGPDDARGSTSRSSVARPAPRRPRGCHTDGFRCRSTPRPCESGSRRAQDPGCRR